MESPKVEKVSHWLSKQRILQIPTISPSENEAKLRDVSVKQGLKLCLKDHLGTTLYNDRTNPQISMKYRNFMLLNYLFGGEVVADVVIIWGRANPFPLKSSRNSSSFFQ